MSKFVRRTDEIVSHRSGGRIGGVRHAKVGRPAVEDEGAMFSTDPVVGGVINLVCVKSLARLALGGVVLPKEIWRRTRRKAGANAIITASRVFWCEGYAVDPGDREIDDQLSPDWRVRS